MKNEKCKIKTLEISSSVNNMIALDLKLEGLFTEAYKGHCVLCKNVLSFVFQIYDFQVLCFGFCVLCPVLLNGAMET